MPATAIRRRATVEQYHEMIRTGELGENDNVELINGEIVPKTPVGNPHIATVRRLNRFFHKAVGELAVIGVRDPVVLSDSEPEPDVSVLKPDVGMRKGRADDVLLIIEVADSSEAFDRDEKGPMYARDGIPEYWLVCLSTNTVEVRRRPAADGTWGEVRIVGAGGRLSPAAFPDVVVPLDEVLPRGG